MPEPPALLASNSSSETPTSLNSLAAKYQSQPIYALKSTKLLADRAASEAKKLTIETEVSDSSQAYSWFLDPKPIPDNSQARLPLDTPSERTEVPWLNSKLVTLEKEIACLEKIHQASSLRSKEEAARLEENEQVSSYEYPSVRFSYFSSSFSTDVTGVCHADVENKKASFAVYSQAGTQKQLKKLVKEGYNYLGTLEELKDFKLTNNQTFDHLFPDREGTTLKSRKKKNDPAIRCLVSQQINVSRNAIEVGTLKGPGKGNQLYCNTKYSMDNVIDQKCEATVNSITRRANLKDDNLKNERLIKDLIDTSYNEAARKGKIQTDTVFLADFSIAKEDGVLAWDTSMILDTCEVNFKSIDGRVPFSSKRASVPLTNYNRTIRDRVNFIHSAIVLLSPNSNEFAEYLSENASHRLCLLISSTKKFTKSHKFENHIEQPLLDDLTKIADDARCLEPGNFGNIPPKFDVHQLEVEAERPAFDMRNYRGPYGGFPPYSVKMDDFSRLSSDLASSKSSSIDSSLSKARGFVISEAGPSNSSGFDNETTKEKPKDSTAKTKENIYIN